MVAGRKRPVGAVVGVCGDADLLEVVLALHAGRGAAHLLHGRHQKADEDGDDGDDHEQLDQREPVTPRTALHDASP